METRKELTSYFPHDSNARNSDKLIRLRMRHKAAGYGVFFMILERLREEPSYMSVKDYNMIAFDLREDASLIKSVIEDFGLFVFTEDGKYFYSESFKQRMGFKDEKSRKRSEAGKLGMAKRWGNNNVITNPQNNDNNVITNPQNNDNNVITKTDEIITRKEKERKGNKNRESLNTRETLFDNFKNELLKDEEWRRYACQISGLSVAFNDLIPGELDNFLAWMVSTGEGDTLKTIDDVKRRFTYWWQGTGLRAYNQRYGGTRKETFGGYTSHAGAYGKREAPAKTGVQPSEEARKDYTERF